MPQKLFARVLFPVYGLLAASTVLAQSTRPATGPNLVVNGDFEQGGSGWAFAAIAAQATGEVVKDVVHAGKAAYKLTNKSAFAPHVYGRVFQLVPRLDAFTTYRISCWVKGKDVGIAWIGGGPGWYLRKPFPEGTYDWQQVSTEYTTDGNPPAFELMVATENPAAGIWVDDVRMVAVRADVAKREEVRRQIAAKLKAQQGRVQKLRAVPPRIAKDSIVQLGLSVADRFLRRVQTGGPGGAQAMDWSRLQLEEVAEVLSETEARVARLTAGKESPFVQTWPTAGPVAVRDALFYTKAAGGNTERPFWFYGYGHFGQVFRDLPNFRSLGASIVQESRIGPSAMNPDGSLGEGARTTLADLKRAGQHGLKVDWLLSPHYFPEWAYAKAADVRGGGPGFLTVNIDHPVARQVIGGFAEKMSAAMKREPALFSICLSNEPVYDKSGRDGYSRAAFTDYLKAAHGRIESLNELYGTKHASFDEVPAPAVGLKGTVNENRAYYDWVRFNQKHFADWHAWMGGILKKNLPDVPTHAKIMVFFAFDRDKLHFGVDPELFCHATDLAGCDAYAFPDGDKAYAWHGHEFFYDLLHSFRGQPVFNSENHIIADGSTPWHIPGRMTRSQFWQGGLHHQTATTTWVWEEAGDPSLVGSIYFRPANVYGAGRAMLDLNRFGEQVAAINAVKPRVALLYSQPSVFWEDAYKGTIFSLYTQLNFLGEPVTFVSERQLAEGRAPAVQWIVVPRATHVEDTTVKALEKFMVGGGHVLMVGDGNLAFDPYHRPRTLSDAFARAEKLVPAGDEIATWNALREVLTRGGLVLTKLQDTKSGQPLWGIEFRHVQDGSRTLIPMINLSKEPRTLKAVVAAKSGRDLLSGDGVDLSAVQLEPMVPRLIEVSR